MGGWCLDLCLDWKTLILLPEQLHAITMVSTKGKYNVHRQNRGADRDTMLTRDLHARLDKANCLLVQSVNHAFLIIKDAPYSRKNINVYGNVP